MNKEEKILIVDSQYVLFCGQLRKYYIDNNGYYRFKFRNKPRFIHVEIAEQSFGLRPKGLVINHKDGNKLNNTPSNLEYVTINENIQHSILIGRHVSNDPKRSGRYKHGRATKDKLKQYKSEWYHDNK